MTQRSVVIVKAGIWAACLAPLALLFLRGFGYLGGFGPNAPEFVLDTCGKTGLNLLMLTLCITPIRRSTGWNRLVSFRRLLGLFAFFYLVLHFLTYALLDREFLWDPSGGLARVGEDIALRPYITVGFTALVLLVPLAITSTRALQRRLRRNWTKLHRLVYVAAILAVVHYWWQVKIDVAEPLLYAFLLAVLLGVRLQHWRSVHTKTAVTAPYQRVEPPQASEKASH
jgi:sulfoxide reductase heme-binding subunit YedZ